jgi:hypothetical protein
MRIQNVQGLKQALARAIQKKKQGLVRGLVLAGKLVQRESMAIVPVDYGNLKASAFTRLDKENTNRPEVVVGYTANYAVYVHENLDAAHGAAFNAKYAGELRAARRLRRQRRGGTTGPFRHSRGPNQQAKFLERPLRDNWQQIVRIVATEVAK